MQAQMLDVEGFILVGGQSSRMGSAKSSLSLAGRSSVDLIAAALRPLTTHVRLAGAVAVAGSPLETVADLHPGWGPLAGIEAALQASSTDWSLIVACDLPFVTTDLLARLLVHVSDADAIVPLQSDAYPQPLCAAYRRAACLPVAQTAIEAGKHAPRALLDLVKTYYMKYEEIADLPGSEHFFFNLNTPENYELAKQIAKLKFS